MTPAYDRELIATVIESAARKALTSEAKVALREQARLLREADNAEAAKVGTVAASEDGLNRSDSIFSDWNACCYRDQCRENARRLAASGQGVDSVAVAKAIHEGLRRNGTTVLYSGAFERIVAQAIAAAPTQEKA